jgi:hypothetical protein
MNRTTVIAIALVSAVMTPFVVNAAGRTEAPKPIVVAEATVAVPAATEAAAPADGCARRVRVVYASYHSANGACAAPALAR